jgi:hypothetical protein
MGYVCVRSEIVCVRSEIVWVRSEIVWVRSEIVWVRSNISYVINISNKCNTERFDIDILNTAAVTKGVGRCRMSER